MRKCSARKIGSRFAGTFFIAACLILSCSSSATSVSDDEKEAFINTYIDLTLIQLGKAGNKKTLERAEEQIFLKYGTSKEFMQAFILKISSNPELQAAIYNEISRRLREFNDLPLDSLNDVIKSYTAPEKEK